MSAATPSTATRSAPATMATSRLAKLPVSVACGFAAAAGAVVLYGYGTLAQALDVPMRAGEIGARHAQAITPASFAIGVVFCTVAGTILAIILARRHRDPDHHRPPHARPRPPRAVQVRLTAAHAVALISTGPAGSR